MIILEKTSPFCFPLLEGNFTCYNNILDKSFNRPLRFCPFSSKPKLTLQLYLYPQIGRCVTVNLDMKRFYRTLNIACRMRRLTQVPPFFKFTKFITSSQFVENHLLKYPIFMSKTTSLLKHMTEETNVYRNEQYSGMTLVAMDQNVKTYPTTQCKFLLILKMGVPLECNILNNAKRFSGMVY